MQESDVILNQPELQVVMDKYGIEKDRFARGVIFADYLVSGESATNSYMWAFEVDKNTARKNAGTFRKAKWVQELILLIKPDPNTLYFGEIRQIIRKLMSIIDDFEAENKDKVAAANALVKYIKPPTQSQGLEDVEVSEAAQLMTGLIKGIAQLSQQGKMIERGGEIVDVKVLE